MAAQSKDIPIINDYSRSTHVYSILKKNLSQKKMIFSFMSRGKSSAPETDVSLQSTPAMSSAMHGGVARRQPTTAVRGLTRTYCFDINGSLDL